MTDPTPTDPAVEPMAYAARFPGNPGYGAVTVDNPKYAKSVAKDVAAWIRQGAAVERVTLKYALYGMGEYLAAQIAGKSQQGATL